MCDFFVKGPLALIGFRQTLFLQDVMSTQALTVCPSVGPQGISQIWQLVINLFAHFGKKLVLANLFHGIRYVRIGISLYWSRWPSAIWGWNWYWLIPNLWYLKPRA